MPFMKKEELFELGVFKVGANVLVSTKASIHNPDQLTLGDNSRIDDFVSVSGSVTLGRNVHLATSSNLAGGLLGIEVGDFTGFAYGVQVFTRVDDYSGMTLSNATIPQVFKKTFERRITIGRHCRFGTYAIVLPGSVIGDGCSFSAQTLVTGTLEPNHLYSGNPMVKISKLSDRYLVAENLYLETIKPEL
jgi:acetyltransferase-like isoleucine patch superfamily enzyme